MKTHLPTGIADPLASPDYTVTVNGPTIDVHGAKSCKAPWPFKVFKDGAHPGIKLAGRGQGK